MISQLGSNEMRTGTREFAKFVENMEIAEGYKSIPSHYTLRDESDEYPDYDLADYIQKLQGDILEEVHSVIPAQRRSYLSSIFSYIFQWDKS